MEDKKRVKAVAIIVAVVFLISLSFSISGITGNAILDSGQKILPVNFVALIFFLSGLAGLFFILRNR